MKKLVSLLSAAFLMVAASVSVHAQVGVVGGFTSSQTKFDGAGFNTRSVSLYHAGVLYRGDLGGGFVLQPALTYQMKGLSMTQIAADPGAGTGNQFNSRTGYLEMALGVQFGVDLMFFRPYLFVEPFLGYGLNKGGESYGGWSADDLKASVTAAKNLLEYGFGVGGGIEITRHLQISGQYFMNLGNLFSENKLNLEGLQMDKSLLTNLSNYHGVKISLAILF